MPYPRRGSSKNLAARGRPGSKAWRGALRKSVRDSTKDVHRAGERYRANPSHENARKADYAHERYQEYRDRHAAQTGRKDKVGAKRARREAGAGTRTTWLGPQWGF